MISLRHAASRLQEAQQLSQFQMKVYLRWQCQTACPASTGIGPPTPLGICDAQCITAPGKR